jgi:hypothetical protein
MTRRALEFYAYVAPAVLTPLGAWLWWRHYEGRAGLAAIALLVPIVHAYVVPAVGTNLLGVWEFDTRWRLGRFRPQHGFVFGSTSAIVILLTAGRPNPSATSAALLGRGLAAAIALGVANWIYDVWAIRAGILKVYNQPWADRQGAASIVNDYAPWFFGAFGFIYGVGLGLAESALALDASPIRALAVAAGLVAATITLPTLGYVIQSYLRHGHHGCSPVPRSLGA